MPITHVHYAIVMVMIISVDHALTLNVAHQQVRYWVEALENILHWQPRILFIAGILFIVSAGTFLCHSVPDAPSQYTYIDIGCC